MAATGAYHHVLVLLQDDVGVVVKEEHGYGVEFGGGAARLWYILRVHEVHQRLYDGMVGGIHVSIQGEGTLSIAVVGSVAFRGDNPVLPAQLSEANIQLVFLARRLLIAAVVICLGRPSGSLLRLCGSVEIGRAHV